MMLAPVVILITLPMLIVLFSRRTAVLRRLPVPCRPTLNL
jgi:hypothetical protein